MNGMIIKHTLKLYQTSHNLAVLIVMVQLKYGLTINRCQENALRFLLLRYLRNDLLKVEQKLIMTKVLTMTS